MGFSHYKKDIDVIQIVSDSYKSDVDEQEIIVTCQAMQDMCLILCKVLRMRSSIFYNMGEEYARALSYVCPIHDIGKSKLPNDLITQPRSLSGKEYDQVKTHPRLGFEEFTKTCENSNSLLYNLACDIILYHHEKWDGTGYSMGLAGKAIPLPARIVAIIDVYSALRTKRCYKEAYPHAACCNIIREKSGTHFDPVIASSFAIAAPKINDIFVSSENMKQSVCRAYRQAFV